ncbi:MAG: thiamine diphosphokinase [Dysgonamonadaceae bacterium]|jgi:thiamine pyrophosphokinase|nr:thiamine diphosphokinase [Dysgonamonadaceae bacterium]
MEKNGCRTIIPVLEGFRTVVLADGEFPKHNIPLGFLRAAERVICCDGAAENLLRFGREPDFIVGDLDSISPQLKVRYADILVRIGEQETNDLTKSVNFCVANGWNFITILGATGKREDHTLGNLSLTMDYNDICNVQLLTDYGAFRPQKESKAVYESRAGQQVSIFCIDPATVINSSELVYPILSRGLVSWWQGSLNEASGDSFTIETSGGKLLVFRQYV